MKTVFADTFYWFALANPNDKWHERAMEFSRALGDVRLVTTDEILAEFLTFLRGYGHILRGTAVTLVRSVLANPNVQVVHQSRESFLSAVRHYEARPDKKYSLPDCTAMVTMKRENIEKVLTYDEHFAQEGFRPLFRE